MTPIRVFVAALFMVLSCAVTSCPVAAEGGGSPQTAPSLKEWKASDEITFGGTISEVLAKNPVGAPAGLNLLMNGSQGVLYVSLGPNLSDGVKRELSLGQMIQVVGVVHTLEGQNYLLARELTVGGQKIDIRNEHGFLAHSPASDSSRSPRSSSFGGAR